MRSETDAAADAVILQIEGYLLACDVLIETARENAMALIHEERDKGSPRVDRRVSALHVSLCEMSVLLNYIKCWSRQPDKLNPFAEAIHEAYVTRISSRLGIPVK